MVTRIRWFPRSWTQIVTGDQTIYVDPSYLKTCFHDSTSKIEFSSRPDPIDGLPEELQPADLILVNHHHKDQCKRVTVEQLRKPGTVLAAPS